MGTTSVSKTIQPRSTEDNNFLNLYIAYEGIRGLINFEELKNDEQLKSEIKDAAVNAKLFKKIHGLVQEQVVELIRQIEEEVNKCVLIHQLIKYSRYVWSENCKFINQHFRYLRSNPKAYVVNHISLLLTPFSLPIIFVVAHMIRLPLFYRHLQRGI